VAKVTFNKQKTLFTSKLELNLRKKSEMLHMQHSFIWCGNLETSEKQIRNIWKVLKCGSREGWRRSVGSIVGEMKKYYTVPRKIRILYTQ
jgi:uncharacterized lipoprotein NlpE involved in copper resistance